MTLRDAPLIVASNRGPVTFGLDDRDELVPQRGTGGLVTALVGAVESARGLWVCAAMSDGDRGMTERSPDGLVDVEAAGFPYRVRYLPIPEETYHRYYNVVSNRVLWFAHHYLWDTARQPVFDERFGEAWDAYVTVNRAFAEALASEAGRSSAEPVFLVQDYHLALVPRMLRELRPDALIAHFSHTPFAGATYLRILPDRIREQLLRGMLGADVLGFHSEAWAENFLLSSRLLPGARVDLARSRVLLEGRQTLVRVHPISVDPAAMRQRATSPEVRRLRRELNRWRGDNRLILRVDRLELTKNIVRGFDAFAEFLSRHPEWRGRVRFLALLSPSREELPEYRKYTERCVEAAARINRELGTEDWQPVDVRIRDDHDATLAAYGLYDVLLVNPVIDGMNLVAMEGPLVNRRHGVLVLSRNAGAYGRLGRYAMGVNPFDIGEMADSLADALTMPGEERARRARGLARLVLANPPARWVGAQIEDLEVALRRRARAQAS